MARGGRTRAPRGSDRSPGVNDEGRLNVGSNSSSQTDEFDSPLGGRPFFSLSRSRGCGPGGLAARSVERGNGKNYRVVPAEPEVNELSLAELR